MSALPAERPILGFVGKDKVFLIVGADGLHAFSAVCPHLGGPLDEGVVKDGNAICPWHHACFDLHTGAVLSPPAFDDLPRYEARVENGVAYVRPSGLLSKPEPRRASHAGGEPPMVIVGGGAAGFAAANALRRNSWSGEIKVFSQDSDAPYDRTLLTKDLLEAGSATDFPAIAGHRLEDIGVTLALRAQVDAIDAGRKRVRLRDGGEQSYSKLLLATGAEPRKASFPGADLPHVCYLRSLADGRSLMTSLKPGLRVLVAGGSFIGLEAAASMRSRGLDVTVVAPEARPMAKQFGEVIADLIAGVHREKGVALRFGRKIARLEMDKAILDDGSAVQADLVLIGIGVKPRDDLARSAGLRVDDGVVVNEHLRTSDEHIFAAGDIARWPDRRLGKALRVEHWVVAERQGEIAAANMLGAATPFEYPPFFWTKHFDLSVHYVGHADAWEELQIDGSVADRNATVRYRAQGLDLAVATIGRDIASIEIEQSMATTR